MTGMRKIGFLEVPYIGTIQWENEADRCPDTIYLDSVKI